ncbi:erythromycin esterase family protein [Bacillus sp. BGMRC 2118]|nr:erythromycin esterase family protein [Bacillus sp. BGMRC 2118]
MRPVYLLLIAFTLIGTSGCTQQEPLSKKQSTEAIESPTITPVEYLENHYSHLNIEDIENYSDLDLLKSDIQDYSVFLTGEYHAVQLNYPIQKKLLWYLNQEADVTYYLAELPYSIGLLYNEYLETGNEEILDYVQTESKKTANGVVEQYEFVKDIYQYNQNVTKEKQIRFLAIDSDISMNIGFTALSLLMKGKEASSDLHEILSKMDSHIQPGLFFREQATPEVRNYLEELIQSVETQRDAYETMLGTEFQKFEFIVYNMKQGTELIDANNRSNAEFNVIREGVFKKNFSYWIDQLPENSKFFGEWGREHIYLSELKTQNYTEQIPHLAQILNEEIDQTRGNVLSIGYAYNNSETLDNQSGESYKFKDDLSNITMLTEHAQSESVTLFKLDSHDSPFHKNTFFLQNRSLKEGTTHYFQYIILIQNSKAAGPYQ